MRKQCSTLAAIVLATNVGAGGHASTYDEQLADALTKSGLYSYENAIAFASNINEDDAKKLIEVINMESFSHKSSPIEILPKR